MIDPKLEKALNDQVNKELQAWYSYLSLAAYCKSINFNGFGAYMETHAREEQAHAHRLMNYVLDRGAQIELQSITPPRTEYTSLVEVFARALEQEKQTRARSTSCTSWPRTSTTTRPSPHCSGSSTSRSRKKRS